MPNNDATCYSCQSKKNLCSEQKAFSFQLATINRWLWRMLSGPLAADFSIFSFNSQFHIDFSLSHVHTQLEKECMHTELLGRSLKHGYKWSKLLPDSPQ